MYAVYKQGCVPSGSSWFGQWRAPVGDMSEEKWEQGHYFPGSLSAESLVWLWPSVRSHWSSQCPWLYAILSSSRFQKSSSLPIPLGQKVITAPKPQALGYCTILGGSSHPQFYSLFINEPHQTILSWKDHPFPLATLGFPLCCKWSEHPRHACDRTR